MWTGVVTLSQICKQAGVAVLKETLLKIGQSLNVRYCEHYNNGSANNLNNYSSLYTSKRWHTHRL